MEYNDTNQLIRDILECIEEAMEGDSYELCVWSYLYLIILI